MWLLGEDGPLAGQTLVHLADKTWRRQELVIARRLA